MPVQHISLIDPTSKSRVTDVCWREGRRISLLTGVEIPIPRIDYENYVTGPFDTTAEQVKLVTFKPDIHVPPVPDDCVI